MIMKKPVSVVVPTKDDELLTRLLSSLWQTHPDPRDYIVYVVDGGLRERPFENSRTLTYIRGSEPFCFAKNVNSGIAAADGESDIFLVNDDACFVTYQSLPQLRTAAEGSPSVGIVSPVFARPERNPRQRWGVLSASSNLWIETQIILTFAAVYIRRQLIRAIGLLDESFVGYGFEDNDYCWRTWRSGFQTAILPSVLMMHGDVFGRASTTFRQRADYAQSIRANRDRFIRKWVGELLSLDGSSAETLIRLIDSFG